MEDQPILKGKAPHRPTSGISVKVRSLRQQLQVEALRWRRHGYADQQDQQHNQMLLLPYECLGPALCQTSRPLFSPFLFCDPSQGRRSTHSTLLHNNGICAMPAALHTLSQAEGLKPKWQRMIYIVAWVSAQTLPGCWVGARQFLRWSRILPRSAATVKVAGVWRPKSRQSFTRLLHRI